MNVEITAINAEKNPHGFKKLEGNYQAGYIYGNLKTHKSLTDPPMRPIISQIPSPTYTIAKKIDKIISPYMPAKYMLKSTAEFLDLLRQQKPQGIMSSLDVESLYTNVPVRDTIDIILKNVYNHESLPPPKIPKNSLESLLSICTTEAPFKHIDGTIYTQIDGLAMGSPLSCTMANFYMCEIENKVIENMQIKPLIYCRFVDDIYLVTRDETELQKIKENMEKESVLNFTNESSVQGKIPFLDVLIDSTNSEKYITSVYTKPSKTDECLNYQSEAPDRYKEGIIKTLLTRATRICNTKDNFNAECNRIKKLLINNNYPNVVVDRIIKEYIGKQRAIENQFGSNSDQVNTNSNSDVRRVKVFYKNQYHKNYKMDEKVLRSILKSHILEVAVKIDLVIYYKAAKVSEKLMKNNINSTQTPPHLKSHLVYRFTCNIGECMSLSTKNEYIGMTTCTLKERLNKHRYQGSIFEHFVLEHNGASQRPTIEELLNCTKILYYENNPILLHIFEALHIKNLSPNLNNVSEDFRCLKLNIH